MNPLIMKLECGAVLTDADRTRIQRAIVRTHPVAAHEALIHEGDRPRDVRLVVQGLACRNKVLPDGGRTILALLVPGDFCDLHVALLGRMDHAISTLSPCVIGDIPPEEVQDLTANHPRITRALWWASLVDEAIGREWLASMGRRSSDRQMAHLFCELRVRLGMVGLATDAGYQFPVTQADLGDMLGLSKMHVNRILQQLRADDLVSLKGRRLHILDLARLEAFAEFDPNYLHLQPRNSD